MSRNQTLSGPILRTKAAAAHCGISRATLWRLARQGDFPPPIKLTQGCTGWPQSALDAWLAERVKRGPVRVKA